MAHPSPVMPISSFDPVVQPMVQVGDTDCRSSRSFRFLSEVTHRISPQEPPASIADHPLSAIGPPEGPRIADHRHSAYVSEGSRAVRGTGPPGGGGSCDAVASVHEGTTGRRRLSMTWRRTQCTRLRGLLWTRGRLRCSLPQRAIRWEAACSVHSPAAARRTRRGPAC